MCKPSKLSAVDAIISDRTSHPAVWKLISAGICQQLVCPSNEWLRGLVRATRRHLDWLEAVETIRGHSGLPLARELVARAALELRRYLRRDWSSESEGGEF